MPVLVTGIEIEKQQNLTCLSKKKVFPLFLFQILEAHLQLSPVSEENMCTTKIFHFTLLMFFTLMSMKCAIYS